MHGCFEWPTRPSFDLYEALESPEALARAARRRGQAERELWTLEPRDEPKDPRPASSSVEPGSP